VQLEAKLESTFPLAEHDPRWRGRSLALLVRVERVHVEGALLMEGERDRIDPDKWRPLIMSFQQFYGLAPEKLNESTLGKIPESLYRPPPDLHKVA